VRSIDEGAAVKFEYIFFGLFFSFVAYFGYSMIRHGGLRGALFGAKVLRTVGEVSSSKRGLMSQKLKVHILDAESSVEGAVGIELTSSAPGSWSTTPIRLSNSEARNLIELLELATSADARTQRHPARHGIP
jgi:hypothetical protein